MGIVTNDTDEAAHFGRYVDLVLQTGDRTNRLPQSRYPFCWEHTLTQMWFIDLWPHAIDYIIHLENLDVELMEMEAYLPLKTKTMGHFNKREGRGSEQSVAELPPSGTYDPSDVAKLVNEYLKQDYECLGYPKPNIHGIKFWL